MKTTSLINSNPEASQSLINKIYGVFSDNDVQFSSPISSARTTELELVRGVVRMLQGFSGSLFSWDRKGRRFCVRSGIYVTHLSQSSLGVMLNQFMYAATCLELVQIAVSKVETQLGSPPPTLRAFASSVSSWLKRLRDIALKEETKISNSNGGTLLTLLGLTSSLSSLCSGAEYLLQIVHGAIPQACFEPTSCIPSAEIAVHILDHLYLKLGEVCLVQGGEGDVYQMLVHIFVGTLLPYIEGLDSWLFEGTLDDPFEEMFFYANRAISVDEAEFWEKSYLLRVVQNCKLKVDPSAPIDTNDYVPWTSNKKETTEKEFVSTSSSMKGKEQNNRDLLVCPLFIKDIAKSIVSAGKSLQLIRHVPMTSTLPTSKKNDKYNDGFGSYLDDCDINKMNHWQGMTGLALAEIFCISLAGLLGHGDHISRYFCQGDQSKAEIISSLFSYMKEQIMEYGTAEPLPPSAYSEKIWYNFLVDSLLKKKFIDVEPADKDSCCFPDTKAENMVIHVENKFSLQGAFCPENLVLTVCQTMLDKNRNSWKALNLSEKFCLPPLNDEYLRKAVFGEKSELVSGPHGTNYTLGFQFVESEHLRAQHDTKLLEVLFPFPTLIPALQDDIHMSELLPFQKNSTLSSRVLSWIQTFQPRTTALPIVIMQECLTVYIKKQVDYIGSLILSKLMNGWRLMDELAVLRAIYLLGSGDLLQHFLTVIFNKLDRGETSDDDFELNTILQESIRNSADGLLLSAPDSLVVSISKTHGFDGDEQTNTTTVASALCKSHPHSYGIDGLDSLQFMYKVSWPLELIANSEAIKKYNQVMAFLLKVKRAKFALDKARRWMWKDKGTVRNDRKRHWLVEQKLLHFVDAFHQYVMDRVYHSAWRELCEGMAAAGSLDEVIEVHEAYLLSIHRQCFVAPDKLWALIASRINSILGLALDFYSIQQTLSSGGAVSAIKARCEMEVDRIEKQFDDCIAFLLRVLSFKLNVGHFPHLADLVARINYNNFYMSDGGNLMTTPSSESATARLGKAFAN
ncbi:gamma-tubulin complex component 5-like isoform X2 [Herrania umbratica]|uniref:Gamma-tubulin complex component n=1 Tax=Herrania umbratica TaxID=108875 RepID=A0A6J1BBI2_9ROSI|nr:gamma-tubulin complex component 5-like isoform X2 [Herrania umbratica]